MAEGRRRDEWQRTASVLALIAECNRDSSRRAEPYQPGEFDPFALAEAEEEMDPAWSRTVLKAAFVGNPTLEGQEPCQGKAGGSCETC